MQNCLDFLPLFTLLIIDNFHIYATSVTCMHYIQFQLDLTILWAEAPFCLLQRWEEKEALPELLHDLEAAAAQTSGLFNLVLSCQLSFSECKHPFIDKPMVRTEPVELSTRLLDLASKLYPWPAMCSACLTQIFLDSYRVFLEYAKIE